MAPPKMNDQSPRSSTNVTDDSISLAPAITASSAAADDSERDTEPFRLLDLPPELVIRVLEYAITISNKSKPLRISKVEPTAVQPAITRTCRLLRSEGLKLFYEQNVFEGETSDDGYKALSSWASSIGQGNLVSVERFNVVWCGIYGADRSGLVAGYVSMNRVDFWAEMERMAEQAHPPSGIYIRMGSDRVVMASNRAEDIFRISFRDYSGDPGHWQAVGDLSDIYLDEGNWDDAMIERSNAADFWQVEVDG